MAQDIDRSEHVPAPRRAGAEFRFGAFGLTRGWFGIAASGVGGGVVGAALVPGDWSAVGQGVTVAAAGVVGSAVFLSGLFLGLLGITPKWQRDEARAALGGADPPPTVDVVRYAEAPTDDGILFRLDVHSISEGREQYYAEIVQIEGAGPNGPDLPYAAHWSEPIKPRGHCSIPPKSPRRIDLAAAPRIHAASARQHTGLVNSPWHVYVEGDNGRELHQVPVAGLLQFNDLLSVDLWLTVRIMHEETATDVARKKVRFWYTESGDQFVPQMDGPVDA